MGRELHQLLGIPDHVLNHAATRIRDDAAESVHKRNKGFPIFREWAAERHVSLDPMSFAQGEVARYCDHAIEYVKDLADLCQSGCVGLYPAYAYAEDFYQDLDNKKSQIEGILFGRNVNVSFPLSFPSNALTDFIEEYALSLPATWTLFFFKWIDNHLRPNRYRQLKESIDILDSTKYQLAELKQKYRQTEENYSERDQSIRQGIYIESVTDVLHRIQERMFVRLAAVKV